MKKILLIGVFLFLLTGPGFCQNQQQLVREVTSIYTGSTGENSGAAFSLTRLIGGILFGCVGFVAFVYGKKNAEFKPMILGILLMAYPYFVKSTALTYVVGIVLSAALYYWRD